MGANISSARLLTYEEAIDLGCTDGGYNGDWSCPANYLTRNAYWLGSSYNTSISAPNSGVHICLMYKGGNMNNYYWGHYYGAADDVNAWKFGVRPVIEISKSELQ